MENSDALTIERKLEILHHVIGKMVEALEKQESTVKPSVGDLIRLLEMETELAGKLTPEKTVIQWIDPYLSETNPESGADPPKVG